MIREFIRSSLGVLLADLATKGIGFAMLSGLTFILGPADFGRYTALLTTFTSLYMMAGLGVAMVLQLESARLERDDPDRLGAMIGAAMVITFMAMSGIIFLYVMLHQRIDPWLFKDMDPALVSWVPLLTVLYFLVQMPLSLVLGMGLFRRYAIRNLAESAITTIAVLSGGYIFGLKGIIAALAISYCLNFIIVFLILRAALADRGIQISFSDLKGHSLQLLGKGVPYFIGNTLFGAVAGILLVGIFTTHIGYEELGYVRIGLSLAGLLMIMPNAVKTVTITYLARAGAAAREFFSIQVRYVFFLIVASTLSVLAALNPLVILLFGEPYQAGMSVFAMVLLIHAIFSMQQLVNGFIVGKGMLVLSGMTNGIVVLFYILTSVMLIPRWGLPGYYVAFGGSYMMGLIALLLVTFSNTRERSKSLVLYYSIVSLLVVLAVIAWYTWRNPSWANSVVLIFILMVYGWWTVRFVFTSREKITIRDRTLGVLKSVS